MRAAMDQWPNRLKASVKVKELSILSRGIGNEICTLLFKIEIIIKNVVIP